jgi:hypothetical protein
VPAGWMILFEQLTLLHQQVVILEEILHDVPLTPSPEDAIAVPFLLYLVLVSITSYGFLFKSTDAVASNLLKINQKHQQL